MPTNDRASAEETPTNDDDVPPLFAGVDEAAHLFAKPEPALRSTTFAEKLPRLRKKYPIPLAPHVDSRDPRAALLLRSNFDGHRLAKVITGKTNAEGEAIVESADQLSEQTELFGTKSLAKVPQAFLLLFERGAAR